MDYDVAKKIRERRSELGLTQEQLGARAGMTKLTISRYEGGNRKSSIYKRLDTHASKYAYGTESD